MTKDTLIIILVVALIVMTGISIFRQEVRITDYQGKKEQAEKVIDSLKKLRTADSLTQIRHLATIDSLKKRRKWVGKKTEDAKAAIDTLAMDSVADIIRAGLSR